jgi:uncharacterized protein YjiK
VAGTNSTSTFSGGIQTTALNLTGSATSTFNRGITLAGGCFAINGVCIGTTTGTVTSVQASGGTTGLSFSGGPITSSGTLTLAGTLNVANGGTGWASVLSGALLYGNGTGALATTTAGTNGQVLALANGVPTWVASTTFSSGLTYLGGNVTLDSTFANNLTNSYIHSSSTIAKTYTANTFTALNTFSGGLTIGSLNGPLQANNGVVSATTSVGVLYGGTGLSSAPSYGQLLLGNASGGYTLTATSSLGLASASQASQWTTAGSDIYYNTGKVGIGTSSPYAALSVAGATGVVANVFNATSTTATSTFAGNVAIGRDKNGLTNSQASTTLTIRTQGPNAFWSDTGLYIDAAAYISEIATTTGIKIKGGGVEGSANAVGIENIMTMHYNQNNMIGLYNNFYGTDYSQNNTWGVLNDMIYKTAGDYYGLQNRIGYDYAFGAVTGNSYGVYTDIPNAHEGDPTTATNVYGTYTVGRTFSSGIGNFYGNYVVSNAASTGGTQYGFYADLTAGSSTKYPAILLGGNVGIGTTTPYAALSVAGATGVVANVFNATSTTATSTFAWGVSANAFNMSGTGTSTLSGLTLSRGLNAGSYLYGAGLSSACSGAGDKLIWNNGVFSCGADAGAGGGITALGAQYSSFQTGSSQTFATSSDANIQLTITSVGDVHTFAPSWTGTLSVARGGTGLSSTPSYGEILVGNGTGYTLTATSSLGLASLAQASKWTANGSDIYYNTGNVGIGTTSPYAKLSVAGTVVADRFIATSTTASSTFAWGVQAAALNITGSATSTFANGINLASGCFAVNGVCAGTGNGSVNSGSQYQVAMYSANGTAVSGTSTITIMDERVGIASTTPFGILSVGSTNANNTRPLLSIASSTGSTNLRYGIDGKLAINNGSLALTYNLTNTQVWDSPFTGFTSAINAPATGADPTVTDVTAGTFYVDIQGMQFDTVRGVHVGGPYGSDALGTNYIGVDIDNLQADSGSIIGTAKGLNVQGVTTSNNSLIETNYGIYVGSPYANDANGIRNNYGLFLADMSADNTNLAATSTYAIYSEGGKSYFGGNVGIGTTSPYAALSVAGATGVVANVFNATSTTATSTFAWGLQANALNVTGTATSTFNRGINLAGGCFAVNGTCIGGSSYGDSNVNSYIHSSSTIAKTYTANTFSALNTFNGGLTIGSLNGPLQANNGVVSATTSVGVLYGGTGLSSAPAYGQLLVGNASGGYTLTATSSLGITSQWTTAGSDIYYNTGKVGIGTSSPYAMLSVAGEVVARNFVATSTTMGGFKGSNGSSAFPTFSFINDSDTGIYNYSGFGQIGFAVDGSAILSLDGGGLLAEIGGSAAVPFYGYNSDLGADTGMYSGSEDTLGFSTGGVERLVIGSTGNIGVGTSSPYAALSVAGATGVVANVFNATSTTATSTFAWGLQANALNVTGTATSTFNRGINLSSGCFAINGVCAGTGNGTVNSGTTGQIAYYSGNGTAVVGTSTLTFGTDRTALFTGPVIMNGTGGIGDGYVSVYETSGAQDAFYAESGTYAGILAGSVTTAGGAFFGPGGNVLAGGAVRALDVTGTSVFQGDSDNTTLTIFASAGQSEDVLAVLADEAIASFLNVSPTYLSVDGGSMFYDFSGNKLTVTGSLGIGTTSPGQKLSVAGDILGNNIIGSYFTGTTTATSTLAGGLQTLSLNVTSTLATSTFANGLRVNAGGIQLSSLLNCNTASVLETDANGVITCGSDAGASGTVTSVTNADGTLTIVPTAGDVVASLNLSNSNVWTGLQRFTNASSTRLSVFDTLYIGGSATTTIQGSTSGTSTFQGFINVAGTNSTSTFSGGLAAAALNVTGSATSTFNRGINLAGGCFSINGTCIGGASSQWTTAGSDIHYGTGNVGIGTSTPYAKLSVVGQVVASNFHATNTNATSTFEGGFYASGLAVFDNIQLGAMNFETNAGAVTWVDLPIDASAPNNTVESYSASLNGTPILTVYGQADGAGNIKNTAVGIGTTSPYAALSVAGATGIVANLYTATSTTATSTLQGTVLAALGGSVGIGTTTPGNSALLGIAGNFYVGGQATSTILRGLNVGLLNVSSTTASSTFANGINLTSGCFAVNGTCIGGGGSYGDTNVNSYIHASTTIPKTYTANTFTGLQQFNQSSTTLASVYNGLYVGSNGTTTILGSATSTFGAGVQATYLNITGASASSTFANGINLSAGCFSVNGVCVGSQWTTAGSDIHYGTGNVGIGTSTPYAKLSVVGQVVATNFHATSSSATSTFAGGLNVGNGGLVYDFTTGITSIASLETGAFNFDTDAGMISWTDLPVTSAASSGTVESYTAQIDGNPLLTVFAQADGSGGIMNSRIGVGSTTPYSRFSVWGAGTGTGQLFELTNSASTTLARILDNGTAYLKGNLGIGTTSPYAALSVVGDIVAARFVGTTTATSTLAGGLDALALNVTGTATSTFNRGINLAGGCFAINGTCIGGSGGSGTVSSGTQYQVAFYNADGTTVSGTSTLTIRDEKIGIGTTSPYAKLSVAGQVVADYFTSTSSTASRFPYASTTALSVSGAAYLSGTTTIATASTTLYTDSNRWVGLPELYLTRTYSRFNLGTTSPNNYYNYYLAHLDDDLSSRTQGDSGIAFWPNRGTLLIINNNNHEIYEYTLNGEVLLRTITLTNFTDEEDIVWMYDDTFAILDESESNITITQINSTQTSLNQNAAGNTLISFSGTVGTGTNVGAEGLGYDQDRDLFWIVKEKTSASIHTVSRGGTVTTPFTLATLLTNAGMTDASAIYFDRNTQHIFIAADEGGSDKIIEADTSGNLITTMLAPSAFGQLEGFTFSPDGENMWLSGEADDFARYQYQRPNSAFAIIGTSDYPNIGIGTTSPYAALSVVGASGVVASKFNATSTTATSTFAWGLQANALSILSTSATSTFANGIALSAGCFSLNGSCIGAGSGSGTVSTGVAGYFAYYSGNGTIVDDQTILNISGSNIGIGTSTPYAALSVAGATGVVANVYNATSTTATSTFAGDLRVTGNIGIGSTTQLSKLTIDKNGGIASTSQQTVGINQYYKMDLAGAGTQFGNQMYVVNAPTINANVMVGSMFRVEDSTSLANTVRGIEVQAHRGTNTQGENTGVSAFGRTFGLRGITEGDAGGLFLPAGVFAQTRGTTQGNALRAYSGTITSADLAYLYQDTSTFTGNALLMDMGTGGSFTGNFINLKKAGVSKFVVDDNGTTTIGDGSVQAGLQIGFGGICVDNDGACTASTTGRITAVQMQTANSDLAEMYFSDDELSPGELVYTKGSYTIGRADAKNKGAIIGVVSSKPGLLLGFDDAPTAKAGYPVALAGRVPVKVSTENGTIKAGDKIVLSSIDGIGMKQTGEGMIVGVALEDFDGNTAVGEAVIDQLNDNNEDPTAAQRIVIEEDSCYASGGGEIGSEVCEKTDASERTKVIKDPKTKAATTSIAAAEHLAEQKAEAQKMNVKIGTIQMFVSLGWSRLDANLAGMSTSTIATNWYVDQNTGAMSTDFFMNADFKGIAFNKIRSIASFNNKWSIDENGKVTAEVVEAKAVAATESLEVGTAARPTGITIFDTITNEPYCMQLANGAMKSVKGRCEDIKAPAPTPSMTPSPIQGDEVDETPDTNNSTTTPEATPEPTTTPEPSTPAEGGSGSETPAPTPSTPPVTEPETPTTPVTETPAAEAPATETPAAPASESAPATSAPETESAPEPESASAPAPAAEPKSEPAPAPKTESAPASESSSSESSSSDSASSGSSEPAS